jgi:hypothetical protein
MIQSIAKALACVAPGDELNGPTVNLLKSSLDLAAPRFSGATAPVAIALKHRPRTAALLQ